MAIKRVKTVHQTCVFCVFFLGCFCCCCCSFLFVFTCERHALAFYAVCLFGFQMLLLYYSRKFRYFWLFSFIIMIMRCSEMLRLITEQTFPFELADEFWLIWLAERAFSCWKSLHWMYSDRLDPEIRISVGSFYKFSEILECWEICWILVHYFKVCTSQHTC